MAERDRLVAEFQTDANGPPVFILSLKAGGTGLNLTRANHVFHFDRWWNPAVENQATDRAFRIGQTRNVQVHKYVCAGTFEETLDDLIERKVALAESIVGTSEAWITEMSTDDLRQLFRLRREEAVAEDDGVTSELRVVGAPRPAAAVARHQGAHPARRVRQDRGGPAAGSRRSSGWSTRAAWRAVARTPAPARSCRWTSARDGVRGRRPGQPPAAVQVRIEFKRLSDAEWERVIDAMAAEALYAARLLSGEMPEQIEEVFARGRHQPVPGRRRRHAARRCSCPDRANPCKHIAAVHYLLGERFDDDPFLMFLLRGRSQEEIVDALRARRAVPSRKARPRSKQAVEADVATFWSGPPQTDEVALHFALPESDALAVKRLGPPPFARDQAAFDDGHGAAVPADRRVRAGPGPRRRRPGRGVGQLGPDDPRPRDARPEQSGQ